MYNQNMNSSSSFFWGDITKASFPALKGDTHAKYLIVGGGIAGLSAAYFLLEHGENDIVLIDRSAVGSGATGHSSGMLVCEPETASWPHLVKKYGVPLAKRYYDAQVSALKLLSKIVKQENIPCDFLPEELWILAGNTLAESHIAQDFAVRTSIKSEAHLLSGKQLSQEFTTTSYTSGERIQGSISVNPLLLARGFAKYLGRRGVRIYEHTPLVSVKTGSASTRDGEISHEILIKCMGAGEKSPAIERYLTTISVTARLSRAELNNVGITKNYMFFDDEKRSFHYGKITSDNRLLVGYGDILCKSEYNPDYIHLPHIRSIKRFIQREFPNMSTKIEHSWSAQYALSKTDVPVVAIADGGATINGAGTQLASIAAASYAVSKILKKAHPLDELFKD